MPQQSMFEKQQLTLAGGAGCESVRVTALVTLERAARCSEALAGLT